MDSLNATVSRAIRNLQGRDTTVKAAPIVLELGGLREARLRGVGLSRGPVAAGRVLGRLLGGRSGALGRGGRGSDRG
jgi:hypothetical protein